MGTPAGEVDAAQRNRDRAKAWYWQSEENRARTKRRSREWERTNPEKVAEQKRRWRERNPERRRAAWVKSKYRLTEKQYQELLRHDGTCDVCGEEPATDYDHDHATMHFRGRLCHGCNVAEGFLAGSATRARALADYIERTLPVLET